MIAVLDSSVLVPAWSRVALQQFAVPPRELFVPVWSEWIVAETWRVLTRQWIVRASTHGQPEWGEFTRLANSMMRYLLPAMRTASLHRIDGPGAWPTLRDRDDLPIWHTAVVAHAQYVVSHNISDFPPLVDGRHVFQGIEYLTEIEFIEHILNERIGAVFDQPLPMRMQVRSRRLP